MSRKLTQALTYTMKLAKDFLTYDTKIQLFHFTTWSFLWHEANWTQFQRAQNGSQGTFPEYHALLVKTTFSRKQTFYYIIQKQIINPSVQEQHAARYMRLDGAASLTAKFLRRHQTWHLSWLWNTTLIPLFKTPNYLNMYGRPNRFRTILEARNQWWWITHIYDGWTE